GHGSLAAGSEPGAALWPLQSAGRRLAAGRGRYSAAVPGAVESTEPGRVLGTPLEPGLRRDDRRRRLPAARWPPRQGARDVPRLPLLGPAARAGHQRAGACRLRSAAAVLRPARYAGAGRATAGSVETTHRAVGLAGPRLDPRLAGGAAADSLPSALPPGRGLAAHPDQ